MSGTVQTPSKLGAFLTSPRLSLALRYLLGAIILLSAIPKLVDIEANSIYVVYSYYILPIQPVNYARFAGLVIPYVELLVGLGITFGAFTRLSAIGWMALSLAYFAIKMDLIIVQHRIVPCGCFPGLLPNMLVTQSLWIDVVSVIASCQIILVRKPQIFALQALLPDRWRRSRLRYIW